MKKITAKFNSKCADSGKPIKKGDAMYYDYATKKCYHMESNTVFMLGTTHEEARTDLSNYIQAQEDAYFDNFCQNNNIY